MKKRFTKIICVIVGLIAALGVAFTAGCTGYFSKKPLAADSGAGVASNGGFAVETEGYVYYINGVQSNTADNTFGDPVKGAIYRISKSDLSSRNYSNAECVVPLVAYTADYDAGLFIYGGYIYYATPSTDKSATGQVQSDKLELKRTSLDGSKTMRGSFAQFSATSFKHRFVEVDGTVYLMYVATSEALFDEGKDKGVTNLHSVKIDKNGTATDTLLAYNVDTVVFDKTDKTNPRAYYTMKVKDYSRNADFGYNQVYTVRADATEDKFATEAKKAELEAIEGWNTDADKGDVTRYINCGDLVFDGIGKADVVAADNKATPFNYKPDGSEFNDRRLTYTLSSYQGGTLFYTRTTALPSSSTSASLFSVKDTQALAEGFNPVKDNAAEDSYIVLDGSGADKYTYVFDTDKNLQKVLISDSDGGIYVNQLVGGKMQTAEEKNSETYFPIVKSGDCTALLTDGSYLYHSIGGDSGYSFWRVDYTGVKNDYGLMPVEDEYDDYRAVQLLDLSGVSDWFMPEILGSHIFFASNTDSSFSAVNYVMAFDLRSRTDSATLMDNAALHTLKVQYEGITETIDEFGDTEKYDVKIYANITGAIKYAYYSGESADVYLEELAKECNAAALKADEDADPVYSEETLKKYAEFLAPAAGTEWAEYTDKLTINGAEVYSNRRDYYYSYVGVMSESDAKDYSAALKTANLNSMPEKVSWYNGLKTVEKVFFIIGMCLIGLGVIAAVVVPVTIVLVKKRRGNLSVRRKRKIKVDTTDDRNIDVYSDDMQ